MKPHHLHAAPAGSSKRGSVSFDIGRNVRVRMDGGTDKEKVAYVHRLCFLWNMHEGIPIDVLESGAIRKFNDAVQGRLDAVATGTHSETSRAAKAVEKAWDEIKIEYTKDGRRADCSCSEKDPNRENRRRRKPVSGNAG
jgi:hypothetical protein